MEKTDEQLINESNYPDLKRFTHSDMYTLLGLVSYAQWVLGNIKSHLPKRFYTIEIKPSKKVEEELAEGLCLEAKLNQQ